MAVLRSIAVVLVIGAVVAALVGYRATIQHRFSAQDVVEETFRVADAPRVVVETFNGAVEVTTIPEARVEARVTRRATGSTQEAADEALDEIEVSIQLDANTVRVVARRPDDQWISGERSAAVLIQVPAGALLDLRTRNGKVEALGPTGAVTVATSNGPIRVNGSRGGLSLTTSNGAIHVEDGRGVVELRTSNGPIHLKAKDAVVSARTSNGAIRCEGTLANGDHALQSSNGRVTVTLPADSSFHLDARTSSGKITSAFEVKKQGKPQKRRLQGHVGADPKMSLRLETSNGSIELHKAASGE